MKFHEMPYTRPNIDLAAAEITQLQQQVATATDAPALLSAYRQLCALLDDANTQGTIASIRHTVDTQDEFYNAENDYFDEKSPILADKVLCFYRAVLSSPHHHILTQHYGPILLEKMSLAVRSSQEKLIPLQQAENALATAYEKLYASARIPFGGQTLTVAQLQPYKQDPNRATRRDAFFAEGSFFDTHQDELDELFTKLVENRTQQAQLMGYSSFTPLGDIRMERLGYTRADITACRRAVLSGIVPNAEKLLSMQAQRLGITDFCFYDTPLVFPGGNPLPTGTPEEILAAGQHMYQNLSPETSAFITFMLDNELFDVLAKPGKAPGGYCTYIPAYKSPFIFSNFNGTAGDVDVLTHEAGHAFAAYLAAQQNLPPELRSPGLESCEIHSMSMEFLTQDYHAAFFGDATDHYAIYHAQDALTFLPYGCQVDEFQETIYNQPHLTAAQRNELWLELEHRYRPWNHFADIPFYGRGAGWQRQLHIYVSPFYYIDYVLAQSVALSFFLAHNANPADAWRRYLALTEKAGCATYGDLVHAAGFETPFTPGAMRQTGDAIFRWIIARLGTAAPE